MPKKITFHEPSKYLEESDLTNVKVTQILATAKGLRKALDEVQAACEHPDHAIIRDPGPGRFQCRICGYTTPFDPRRYR